LTDQREDTNEAEEEAIHPMPQRTSEKREKLDPAQPHELED
jgi:hypothetical protein